ncbi:MAG: metallophosphoesterase [bacterium]|nr:metallophosphoesterase [bacterium]
MRRHWMLIATLLLLGSLVSLGIWGFYLEPRSLRVREYALEIPDWPPALDGLRVALLADLHVGSPHNGIDQLKRIVEWTNAAAPDLVLITGDMVVGRIPFSTPVPIEDWTAILAQLSAPLGTYIVLGNEDWASGGGLIRRELLKHPLNVLNDESARIEVDGLGLWIVGISDLWRAPHNIERAFSRVNDGAPVLAMTHNPDLFPEIPARASLTVAGHTHGGQVRFPLFGAVTVTSRYGQRYVRGHIVEDGRHLFVATGIGLSVMPVRIDVPPEIPILKLRGRRSGSWGDYDSRDLAESADGGIDSR